MSKKTLIINGSPRINGDSAFLISELKKHLDGEVVELSAFRSDIAPCVDCRGCWETAKCVVEDEMQVIYNDDFDNVVLASPVYFMTLPGKVLSLMSRFQPQHVAQFFLNKPLNLKEKKGGLIITAGGKGNAKGAEHHIRVFFKLMNAKGYEEHFAASMKTDEIPADKDMQAIADVEALAKWLNE